MRIKQFYLCKEFQALCSFPFDRQLHLLVQCQPCPQAMMVKARVNGLDWIGHLVTRTAFHFGKMYIVTISDLFIDLNYRSTYSNMIPPTANWKAQSRLKMGNFSLMENLSLSSRSVIPPTSNGMMLVFSMLRSPL